MTSASELRATFNAAPPDRTPDPVSDPEPPVPPLPEPDPGVFHHELDKPATPPATPDPEKDHA